MSKDFSKMTADISATLRTMHGELPGVMKGFGELARNASQNGALPSKTKELISLALGVAGHCDACIGFHTKTLVSQGVTREEFLETLGVAVYMGGGPSLMYAAEALQAYEQFKGA
jgi:AhpD family alkylhydroperoxidase